MLRYRRRLAYKDEKHQIHLAYKEVLIKQTNLINTQFNDLIARFKTYTNGNNKEHELLIESMNEAISGTVENLKNKVYTPKEIKLKIGSDENVQLGFKQSEKLIKKEIEEFINLINSL